MRTLDYPVVSSQNAERVAKFRQQMADFARGQELVRLREQRHLSQEDAAHNIGTTAKSLRGWEHGGPIRWGNAKRVAAFYGVEPEGLVSRELPDPETITTLSAEDSERIDRIEKEQREQREILEELLRRTAPPEQPPDTGPPGGAGPPPDEPIPGEPPPPTEPPADEGTG